MDRRIPFNNLSKEYNQQIENLVKSQDVHTFKLLTGKMMQRLVNGSWVPQMVYNSVYGLPVRDTVIDPKSGETVQIAALQGYDDRDQPVFYQKNVLDTDNGYVMWDRRDPEGLAWLRFIYASNFLKDNANRNKNVEAILETVSELKEAKQRTLARNRLAEAILRMKKMSDKDVKDFVAAMGWDETKEKEILNDKVETLAINNPELFLDLVDDSATEYKSVLKRVITAGKADYNYGDMTVSLKGQPVAKLDTPGRGQTYLDMWAKWVMTAPNGFKIFELMQKELAPEPEQSEVKKK